MVEAIDRFISWKRERGQIRKEIRGIKRKNEGKVKNIISFLLDENGYRGYEEKFELDQEGGLALRLTNINKQTTFEGIKRYGNLNDKLQVTFLAYNSTEECFGVTLSIEGAIQWINKGGDGKGNVESRDFKKLHLSDQLDYHIGLNQVLKSAEKALAGETGERMVE